MALSILVFLLACKGDDDKPINPNKIVLGGNNDDPQMGLFVLSPADAAAVDAKHGSDAKAAYELASELAAKQFSGDRNFCEDSVRMTIGYLGIDGMLDDEARETWKTADFEEIKARHMGDINELHKTMIGESAPELCEKTLRGYVENMRFAAQEDLELRNFGF